MTLCLGKNINFGIDRNLCINQEVDGINPEMIGVEIIKLIQRKRVQKSLGKFFCRFCTQVAMNNPMACLILSKVYFAKGFEGHKKNFPFLYIL